MSDTRHLVTDNLDDTLVVEAAAGTGKTTALVRRIVRLLASGAAGSITEVVAVTFTEKAAGELKLRLREEIERARAAAGARPDEAARLEDAVRRFEEAHISTIHGFCAELLRERPVESRVDPACAVLTESQADRLYNEAFDDWLQRQLADPDEGVRRSLRRPQLTNFGMDEEEGGPVARLRRAGRDLLGWRDHRGPWSRPTFNRDAVLDALLQGVRRCADLTALPINVRDTLYTDTAPARTFADEVTRAHAAFVLWRGGEQALANVLHLGDLARKYEAEGGLSFRGFVEMLQEAAGRAEAPEAPILEEGSEGVRLTTVHKAKGLECPVVILVDIDCKLSRPDASRHIDAAREPAAIKLGGWAPVDLLEHNAEEAARDAAEGVRLAYVAATRARDLLVVPAVGDGPHEGGWIAPLSGGIYPPVDQRQDPAPAPGCPVFAGRDTVLERPNHEGLGRTTVRPGGYALTDPASGDPYQVDVYRRQVALCDAGIARATASPRAASSCDSDHVQTRRTRRPRRPHEKSLFREHRTLNRRAFVRIVESRIPRAEPSACSSWPSCPSCLYVVTPVRPRAA